MSNLDELIKNSLIELKKVYTAEGTLTSHKSKLIFPNYNNHKDNIDKTRISEQEARFLLTRELESPRNTDLYYSIETPTQKKYRFSDDGKLLKNPRIDEKGRSASIDLAIHKWNEEKFIITNLIEFKFGNNKTCRKDLLKLLCDNKDCDKDCNTDCNTDYYINILLSCDSGTIDGLKKKINDSIEYINSEYQKEVTKGNLKVIILILGENKDKQFDGADYLVFEFPKDKLDNIEFKPLIKEKLG